MTCAGESFDRWMRECLYPMLHHLEPTIEQLQCADEVEAEKQLPLISSLLIVTDSFS